MSKYLLIDILSYQQQLAATPSYPQLLPATPSYPQLPPAALAYPHYPQLPPAAPSYPHLPLKVELRAARDFPGGWGVGGGAEVEIQLSSAGA